MSPRILPVNQTNFTFANPETTESIAVMAACKRKFDSY